MGFRNISFLLVVFLLTVAARLPAAEIQLRAAGQAQGTVVTLGDVADVLTADRRQAEALAAVELFPASAVGRSRILRVQEIQEILTARQINLGEHRFSGSNQVVVTVAAAAVEPVQRPVSPAAIKQAERLVTDAVVRYLKDHAGADESWNATLKVERAPGPGGSRKPEDLGPRWAGAVGGKSTFRADARLAQRAGDVPRRGANCHAAAGRSGRRHAAQGRDHPQYRRAVGGRRCKRYGRGGPPLDR